MIISFVTHVMATIHNMFICVTMVYARKEVVLKIIQSCAGKKVKRCKSANGHDWRVGILTS